MMAGISRWGMTRDDEVHFRSNAVMIHQYKRLTRFREVLREIQGLGEGHIPEHVKQVVLEQAIKFGVVNLTPDFVRSMLKRRRMGKWHEYCVRLSLEVKVPGRTRRYEPVLIPDKTVQLLERMFRMCDRIWPTIQRQIKEKWDIDRRSFPSYISLIYNFLLLLEEYSLAKRIEEHLLKSDELAYRQQLYWQLFCYALNWPYYRLNGQPQLCANTKRKERPWEDLKVPRTRTSPRPPLQPQPPNDLRPVHEKLQWKGETFLLQQLCLPPPHPHPVPVERVSTLCSRTIGNSLLDITNHKKNGGNNTNLHSILMQIRQLTINEI
jgi:hypothetical protein